MKKKYEKPRLNALSLRGNENLCGSCGTRWNDPNFQATLGPILSGADPNMLFGPGEGCGMPVDAFCKFTAQEQGSTAIFNS